MVEPPIKKGDRQPKPQTEVTPEATPEATPEKKSFVPPVKTNRKDRDGDRNNRQDRDKGKDKGRGRKSSGRDEIKAPTNPALARPPKPAKPPVKVEPSPEEVSEVVAEESQDSNQAATEAVSNEEQSN